MASVSSTQTLVVTDVEPGEQPQPVDFPVKPTRDPQYPDGFLLWKGSLNLLLRIELTADNPPQLVVFAQRYWADTFPDGVPQLHVLIVPNKGPGLIPPNEIAVVDSSEFEGWGTPEGGHR
jgi:hypothetical protein